MTKRSTASHRVVAPTAHTGPGLRTVAGIGFSIGTVVAGGAVANADPVVPADAAGSAADSASTPVDLSPLPSDADGLLERLNEVSRQAEATSDDVTENQAALADARDLLDRSNQSVAWYTARADEALRLADDARVPVTELSQSLYRGATVDPVTAAMGSANPQDAIDRSAYGSALNASRTAKVENLQETLADAAASKSLALRSKATADFRLVEYGRRQGELDARNAELDGLKQQIAAAVDGMPQDQKQRWIDRNGPIDVDVDQFLNAVSAVGGGVVGAALSKLGSPYSWGATGPDAFDCSGLMYWAYQQLGMTIPRTAAAQIAGGTPVSRDQLRPGDIVGYYSGVSHVGMYIGDGKIVHASDYGIPVQVVSVDSMPFAGAVRY
ncbi:NlpC/P60 family protein [uncultured Corynebacterium sp.]|uniref:NlpC/P60 family protein n=1 Tax=uncultured Corynebacterium sp. TaxID=159447 RepID=UPI0025CCC801|nr:NlpC/P60 family protein [uncultured Corynebacterium sp.]